MLSAKEAEVLDDAIVLRHALLEEEEPTRSTKDFRIGDHVSWNSEAGRVSGTRYCDPHQAFRLQRTCPSRLGGLSAI